MYNPDAIKRVSKECQCGESLARDMLIQAGWDEDLVIKASYQSEDIGEFKARVLDARFNKIEQQLD